MLVKSRIGRHLQARVTEMTNINRKDLEGGTPFLGVVAAFQNWIGGREHVMLSWGDGDIRVLLSNTRYHTSVRTLRYIDSYVDLQEYIRCRMHTTKAQQMGLAAAGELLGIDDAGYFLHRALDDSRFAAKCFQAVYDPAEFPRHVRKCDANFFAELEYKPRVISDIHNPLVDPRQLFYLCRNCGKPARQRTEWRFASKGFQAEFFCPHCNIHARATVTFRKMYNHVEIKRSAKELGEEDLSTRNAQ
jgi:inhibitor of KinA sporulation pathway (predicted exonuclease)